MLQIEGTIISLEILEKKFCCDLCKCKGSCCVLGDSGAPLTKEEADILAQIYTEIKPFLREEGIQSIESNGFFVLDKDNDIVTPLVNNEECAYAIFEDGIAKCAIEKAFEAGKISFQKPVSCHLYPIRITKYSSFDALNYHSWEICKPALKNGNHLKVSLYQFLKNPLIRQYGENWYEQLKIAAQEINKSL